MNPELFDAMLEAGFNPPSILKPTGEVTRFNVGNGKNNKDGWLTIFLDGKGAVFGDWKSGNKFTWFESSVVQESTETVAERNAAMQRAVTERENRYHRAAIESQRIYENETISCDGHGYLDRKNVGACNGLRIGLDGRLIVPVFDKNETIQSLQYIEENGDKRFQKDGKMKGGCFVIGELERGKKALMCEGLATALTCNTATGLPVIVAFNAGNLKAVFEQFKNDVDIYIAADNDAHGKGYKCALDCVPPDKVLMPSVIGDFNDIGIDATKEMFASITKKNEPKPFLIPVSEIMANVTPTNWLMKGWIEAGAIGIVFGESGAGKSLFTLDWAFCLANGIDWHGNKVKKEIHVLYIAGEGGRGFAMRIQAIQQKYNRKTKDNIFFSSRSVDLLDKKSAQQIIDSVSSMDLKPEMIFIDTLHRNMNGDENSAADIALFLDSLEVLRDLYGCTIFPVHHSGLSDKGRVRGSSSIKGGMDAEFCVMKNNDFEISIQCTKMKDAGKPAPLKFVITPVELEGDCWYDEDDEKQTTGVYLTLLGVDTEREQKLLERDEIVLEALKKAVKEVGISGESVTALGEFQQVVKLDVFKKYAYSELKGKNNWRDFERSINSLTSRRYIGMDNDWFWVLEQ